MTDSIRALATRFFGAIESGDVDAVAACYAPDVRIWHNNDRKEQTRDENLAVIKGLFKAFTELRYEDARLITYEGGFVEQHIFTGKMANGGKLELPACIIAQVRDGLITRIDEYFDTAALS